MMELIYCQKDIPREQWRYGLRSSAATGCGWIATYNALQLMDYRVQPEKLIRYYERMLPLIHGNAGTMFFAPLLCFRNWGFPAQIWYDRKKFDQAARDAKACILYYHWRSKWKLGAHFVALHHTDRGFVGYNTYSNSKGPDLYGSSLEKFLEDRGYHLTVLITMGEK